MLTRLNPKNSIFGIIFIWFWLAITTMVIGAFAVSRLINQHLSVHAASAQQIESADNTIAAAQRLLNREQNIERALRRAGRRSQASLLAINTGSQKVYLGFPPFLLRNPQPYIELAESEQALVSRSQNFEFLGPFSVMHNGQEYQVFIGRILSREERTNFAFIASLILFLIIGSLACIGIAVTIAKPIKQLSRHSIYLANTKQPHDNIKLKNRSDEIGQLYKDIETMANNLSHSLNQQKQLLANVSHELRTPLTRMQLAIAMIEHKNDQSSDYAKRLEKEISVMDKLIGQALQIAKYDTEQTGSSLHKQPHDLPQLVSVVLDDLRFEAQAHDRTLMCGDIADENVNLNADSFISALENVTRNAIKYSNKKVQLSFELVSQADSATSEQLLQVSIEDDGEGLAKEQQELIFTPFYRAPDSQSKQGTGLGLSIAKAAVDLHQGQIIAHQSSLGGLKVTMRFKVS